MRQYVTKSENKQSKTPKYVIKDKIKSKQQAEDLKGLCVNCDHRFSCLMSHQTGGVWYCEEYA